MTLLFTQVKKALNEALVLFLPLRCAGCDRPDVVVCDECVARIEHRVQYRELFLEQTHTRLPLYYCAELREPLTQIMYNFKDTGYTATKKFLAGLMITAVQELAARCPDAVWVYPPSPSQNFRKRGYRPVQILANECGVHTSPLLVNVSRRKDQTALGRADRKRNMFMSLRATGSLEGVEVVIMDDIMTTGATLEECARALSDAGAVVVGAVVLAHAPRKLSDNLQAKQVTEGDLWD